MLLPCAWVIVSRLCLVGVCAAAENAAAPRLTFYASFDKQTTDADFACGKKESIPSRRLAPGNTKGINWSGLANERGQHTGYSAEGNIRNEAGTLAFWVKTVDWYWDSKDPETYHYLCNFNMPGIGLGLIYKNPDSKCVQFYMDNGGSKAAREHVQVLLPAAGAWANGDWHYVAATWDKNFIAFYVDGVTAQKVPTPENLIRPATGKGGDLVFAANGRKCKAPDSAVLDEIKIWDAALSPEQVLKEYQTVKDGAK